MATINNVKHLTEEGVYEFLHNPNENYFEGFAVDKEPAFYCPRNCEDGAYIKLFKAPVNSRMTELFMQNFRWSAREGCYNTPLPEFCKRRPCSNEPFTVCCLLRLGTLESRLS